MLIALIALLLNFDGIYTSMLLAFFASGLFLFLVKTNYSFILVLIVRCLLRKLIGLCAFVSIISYLWFKLIFL
jgi:hypothetical protein